MRLGDKGYQTALSVLLLGVVGFFLLWLGVNAIIVAGILIGFVVISSYRSTAATDGGDRAKSTPRAVAFGVRVVVGGALLVGGYLAMRGLPMLQLLILAIALRQAVMPRLDQLIDRGLRQRFPSAD